MANPPRSLTSGEIAMLRSVFAGDIDYGRVRVHSTRWAFPFPKDRAMAPNGKMYFPGNTYAEDFAAATVPIRRRATFVHEGAHLYQRYGLGYCVWARAPFDRDYDYALAPGKRYRDYGLEQMAMIAEDYFILRSGGRIALPYTLADYDALLPVV